MPRDHSAVASISSCGESALLATTMMGFFTRRSMLTTASSVAVTPTVTSSTSSTASAFSTASSAWSATRLLMPLASCSQPPVSTRVKFLPFHSAL